MANYKKINVDKQICGCLLDDLLDSGECVSEDASDEYLVNPDAERISREFYVKLMTDGLPIIPPTNERVKKFIAKSNLESDSLIALLPPMMGKATIERVAINAVMAGCLPAFMPIIESSIKAISKDEFNLAGLNATTHPVALACIINGPITNELGVNSGTGCLGPGNMANATIGRALRLCMINIAGAIPGVGDHATHGSPAKYSYCFAEAEEESPWEPLMVEKGFNGNVVTLMGLEGPQNVNDHRSTIAEDLLDSIAHTASTAGCNNSHVPGELLVIMSPEHAQSLERQGWDKKNVKSYLHEKMKVPTILGDRGGRKLEDKFILGDEVKITRSSEDVVIVVAGGPGRHTMIAHGFGNGSQSVTQPL